MRHRGSRQVLVRALAVAWLSSQATASAQVAASRVDLPSFEGPPAPVAPEVINRSDDGRATIRAVRLTAPLRIDGALDEAHYRNVPGITGFIQIEPSTGQQAR